MRGSMLAAAMFALLDACRDSLPPPDPAEPPADASTPMQASPPTTGCAGATTDEEKRACAAGPIDTFSPDARTAAIALVRLHDAVAAISPAPGAKVRWCGTRGDEDAGYIRNAIGRDLACAKSGATACPGADPSKVAVLASTDSGWPQIDFQPRPEEHAFMFQIFWSLHEPDFCKIKLKATLLPAEGSGSDKVVLTAAGFTDRLEPDELFVEPGEK